MMKALLTSAKRIAQRNAPATVVAAAAALSLGTYSGYAAVVGHHHKAAQPMFTLALRRTAVTLSPGSTTHLMVGIHRRHLRAAVSFRVMSRLPSGISVRLAPTRTRGTGTNLTIRVASKLPSRRYLLRLRGSAGHLRRMITLILNLAKPAAGPARTGQPARFSVTGNAAGLLEPGVQQAIDAVIANPSSLPLSITSLVVTVQGVTAPQATAPLPCGPSDFAVQQYAGRLPLSVPASSTRSLSELGVSPAQWPQISILDLPSNQDGCRGASLRLGFAGDGSLG